MCMTTGTTHVPEASSFTSLRSGHRTEDIDICPGGRLPDLSERAFAWMVGYGISELINYVVTGQSGHPSHSYVG